MNDPWDNMTISIGGYSDMDDDTITITSPSLSTTLGYGDLSTTMPTATSGTWAAGGPGAVLSTTTNGTLSWNNPTYTATASPYTVNSSTVWANAYGHNAGINVQGDANFEGDVKIKGVNLTERLDAIEERLAILRPNNDLEGKWEKLKELGEAYRKLEKEILEGENMWDILKK